MEAGKKREIPKKLPLCLLFGGILVMCLEMGLSILRPGAPGSPVRHAALWAGCFGILAAGTLLVNYWQPMAKAWARLNEKLMDPETRKPWIDIVLAVAAGALLLHHFYVILYYPAVPAGASKLAPVMIALAAVTAVLGRSWRDRGTRLGALLLVFLFERTYLEQRTLTGNGMVFFSDAIYAVFICYGLLSALRPSVRRPFLSVLCVLWSLGMCVLCGAGLYTAWTGKEVLNLAGGAIRVHEYRLELFSNPDIAGGWGTCCFAVALTGFALFRNRIVRAAFALTAFAAALTISLTDSRSAFMMVAFMLAGTVCLAVWGMWMRKAEIRRRGNRTAVLAASLLVCFALCFVLTLAAETRLTNLYMKVRSQGGVLIPSAQAEQLGADAAEETPEITAQPPRFIERDSLLSGRAVGDYGLSGRLSIWGDALRAVTAGPEKLLFGYSVNGAAAAVGRTDHLHNILVQTLTEGGLSALLLFLGLLLYFFLHACRLWARWRLPLWQRMLPVPALAILFQEMAECLTHFSFGHPPMTLLWFFMGCTVAFSRQIAAEEAGKTAGSLPRSMTGG